MHCTSCTIAIDGDLEDTDGITSARTSFAKAITEISFDPTKINERKIQAIIKKTGYTVEPL